MRQVCVGDSVTVADADGKRLRRVAVTGPMDGDDFRVVWVCKPEYWPSERDSITRLNSIAWPVEYVSPE